MNFAEFDELVGQDSYVRCKGKKRIDTAIVSSAIAADHVEHGGQIGWWVKSGYIIVDIDEGKEEALKAIKRFFDIKDYGHLIPGHGGIMDRFDSMIITAPIIYFLAYHFI